MIEDPDYQMPWPPSSWLQPVVPPQESVSSLEYPVVLGAGVDLPPPPPPPPPPPQKVGPLLGGVQPADEVAQGRRDDAKDLAAIDANIGEDIKNAPGSEPGPMPIDPYAGPAPPPPDSTQTDIQPPQTPENNVWLAELAKAGLRPPPPPGPDAISGADASAAPGALNPEQADEQRSIYLATHPAELAKANVNADLEMRREYARRQQKLQDDDEKQAIADHTAHVTALEKSRQESAQLDADAMKIANTKLSPDIGDTIGNMIAGALGGLASSTTGGRNLPIEQLNKRIELNWEAQKANRELQWRVIEARRGGIANRAEQEAADYREKEAFRIGTYQRAMNAVQTKMQDFDPRGTQVRALANQYAGIAGAAQQAKAKFDQTNFENNLKLTGAVQKQQEIAETRREHDLQYAEKMAKIKPGGGTGAGGTASGNPNYAVQTGFFDPFTLEPVYGRRAIGGKGEDPKERNELDTNIKTYKHVTDTLSKMQRIAEEIGGGGKGIEESLWSKRKSTLGAKYDAAKEELTSYLTKAIGDRPTQGQLELQAKRIPDRASVFESRDPVALLQDQADANDRAFAADLDTIGVNAAPLVDHARSSRASAPAPGAEAEAGAAYAAAAGAKNPKDARNASEAADIADQRLTAEAQRKKDAADAVKTASILGPLSPRYVNESMPAEQQGHYTAINEVTDTYNQRLRKYHETVAAGIPKLPKGKGDVAEVVKKYQDSIADSALKLVEARRAVDLAIQRTPQQYQIDTGYH